MAPYRAVVPSVLLLFIVACGAGPLGRSAESRSAIDPDDPDNVAVVDPDDAGTAPDDDQDASDDDAAADAGTDPAPDDPPPPAMDPPPMDPPDAGVMPDNTEDMQTPPMDDTTDPQDFWSICEAALQNVWQGACTLGQNLTDAAIYTFCDFYLDANGYPTTGIRRTIARSVCIAKVNNALQQGLCMLNNQSSSDQDGGL